MGKVKTMMNLPSEEHFNIKEEVIAGNTCVLIFPKNIGIPWSPETAKYRSSIWRKSDGFLVSAGFKKFVNMGEKEDIFPPVKSLNNTSIVTKIDGSLLCLSKYKDQYIIRTRGTFDASKLENGHEIQIFKDKILNIFLEKEKSEKSKESWNYSLLFEWTSPNNKIVLDYGDKPEWYFIGAINHDSYLLIPQKKLDDIAEDNNWKRPETYTFNSLTELAANVKEWKDKEGVCLYYNNDQSIVKIKADSYLVRHAFKENATLENVIDLFLSYGKPDYKTFCEKITTQFDFECLGLVVGLISNVLDAYKEVQKIESAMESFVLQIKHLSRKEIAGKIISSFGNTNRAGFVFQKLDNKSWGDKEYKKLLFQVLK